MSSSKDKQTLIAIARIYCGHFHPCALKGADNICASCASLVETTFSRTLNCPHNHSHNCEDCQTKCQCGTSREDICNMMAYAAPRMLLKHPIMTLKYILRKLKRQRTL